MSDWMQQIISGLAGGSIVTVIAAAYIKVINARSKISREGRQDEIAVLQRAIDELREDRNKAGTERRDEIESHRKELQKYSKELGELKSEHTACLIEQQRLRSSEANLIKNTTELTVRVASLERDLDRLRKEVGDGKNTSGG